MQLTRNLILPIVLVGVLLTGVIGLGSYYAFKPTPPKAVSLVLPDKVSGTKGSFIVINALTDCEEVKWYIADSNLQVFPTELVKLKKSLVVIANKDGVYKIVAVTANSKGLLSEFAVTTVYVGDNPLPPEPPGPEPTDPFFTKLKEAYNKETDKSKKNGLQEVFAYANSIVDDARMKTVGDVHYTLHEAINLKLGGNDVLKGVRSTIEAELNTKLPVAVNTPLSDEVKSKLKEQFKRMAELLKAL